MTGYEWAMLIMAAISTASAATSGTDVENELTTTPSGGAAPNVGDILAGAAGPLPPSKPKTPTLEKSTLAAATAAAAVPQTEVTTQPEIPIPPTDGAPATEPNANIEQVLAALPQALVALAPLLGLTDEPRVPQRPAPIAGGQPGGVVGQFAQPFGQGGTSIGQLLAALPGIGR